MRRSWLSEVRERGGVSQALGTACANAERHTTVRYAHGTHGTWREVVWIQIGKESCGSDHAGKVKRASA